MRRWRLLLIGLLAGCVHMGVPTPQIREYQLDYPPPADAGAALPAIVEIGPIGVVAVYDREPMVYREDTYATGAYFDSRWSANPGNMVADLLVRDVSAAGSYRAVQRAPSMLPIDYRLSGEVAEIEERAAEPGCRAHLALRMVLSRSRGTGGSVVLLQRTYEGDEACACNQPARLVAAMSQALAGISARLQRDVYQAIAGDTAMPRSTPLP